MEAIVASIMGRVYVIASLSGLSGLVERKNLANFRCALAAFPSVQHN
jgi:hypothetical protein